MTRILVVDDDVDAADSMVILFDAMGHETRVAYHGAQALEISAEFVPHITFLDLRMPVLDGFAAARQIRASPRTDHPFLVALSGLTDEDIEQQTKAAGFDCYLRKPADTNALLSIIDSFSGRERPSTPRE